MSARAECTTAFLCATAVITILSLFSFLTNGLFHLAGSPGRGAVPSAWAWRRARVTRARCAMRRRSAAVVLRSSSAEGAASAASDAVAAAAAAAAVEAAEAAVAAAGVCPLRCCTDAAEFLPLAPAPAPYAPALWLAGHSSSSATLSPPNREPGVDERTARPAAWTAAGTGTGTAAAAACSRVGVPDGCAADADSAPPLERYRRLMMAEAGAAAAAGACDEEQWSTAASRVAAVSPVNIETIVSIQWRR